MIYLHANAINMFADGALNRSYDINRRLTYAITSIGGHDATARALCGNLNLPPPVFTYDDHVTKITAAAREVASISMVQAVEEAKEKLNSDDISVSVDGTWQKRGYSSRNGVVTCLSNLGKNEGSKLVDTEVLTTYCNKCAQRNNDGIPLARLAEDHDCQINHVGSAGAMEVQGAMNIFKRSVSNRQTRYKYFLGDGDSKTFSEVAKAEVYGNEFPIEKQECTGHVQKRMGKQLMVLVDQYKGKSLLIDRDENLISTTGSQKPDTKKGEKLVKGIGGAKRLTQAAIKSIQGHYGAAIRGNDNVADMRTAIQAILYHRSGEHEHCAQWCPAQKDGDLIAANKHRLPSYICALMKPVFDRLSSDSLLTKCTHGGTQNANESYHHVLWNHCPKEKFVGRQRLELAVADSTIVFNDGELGRLKVFQHLGLRIGRHQQQYALSVDSKRVATAKEAVNPVTISNRKSKNIHKAPVNNTYSAGAF